MSDQARIDGIIAEIIRQRDDALSRLANEMGEKAVLLQHNERVSQELDVVKKALVEMDDKIKALEKEPGKKKRPPKK